MKRSSKTALTTLTLVLIASAVQAAGILLPPGGVVTTPGETYPTNLPEPATGGVVFKQNQPPLVQIPAGSLNEAFFREPNGAFDIVFQLTNTGPSPIASIVLSNYNSYTTAVDYATNSAQIPGLIPSVAGTQPTVAASRSANGSTIIFEFTTDPSTGGLLPGATSNAFFVQTNASDINGSGSATIIGTGTSGSNTVNNLAGQPIGPAVPEPSSLLMGGTAALTGLGYWWRRRRRAVA